MDLSEVVYLREAAYVVPGNPATDAYILPVSGGSDSTALALLLHEIAPHIPFRMVFTDTGAEEKETLEMLDKLEAYLGKKIERISETTLFSLIQDYSGFLPSPRDRWCTRALKLVPFRRWIAQFDGQQKWVFVGIRSEESDRLAFALPDAETEMPFIDLGITRDWVYRKLASTVGISRSYQTRSRSGCTVCPFQTQQELVGLLQRHPEEFERGAQCEKLNARDEARHTPGIPLWSDTPLARNWHSLPMPDDGDSIKKGKLAKAKAPDLFGCRIFIAGEFFFDRMPGCEEFIWHQRVVSFSTTLEGIKRQLDGRFQHLLSTPEVYDMTPEDVRQRARFAIWFVELPSDVFDPSGIRSTGDDRSYTWHQGKSYRQIRHVVDWATRALHAEFQRRQAALNPPLLSVQYEWTESSKEALTEARAPLGSVLLSQWYLPSEVAAEPQTEEEAIRRIPCPMCQL